MKACDLHGTKLKKKEVPIRYGMPAYDAATEVREELFPNAKSYFLGGCMVDFDNPTSENEFVCEECREAEPQWRKENDPFDGD